MQGEGLVGVLGESSVGVSVQRGLCCGGESVLLLTETFRHSASGQHVQSLL
jgi:hypothetical protein